MLNVSRRSVLQPAGSDVSDDDDDEEEREAETTTAEELSWASDEFDEGDSDMLASKTDPFMDDAEVRSLPRLKSFLPSLGCFGHLLVLSCVHFEESHCVYQLLLAYVSSL